MLLEVADYLCIQRKFGQGGNAWPERPAAQQLDALRITEEVRESALAGLEDDPLFASLMAL